MIRPEQRLLIVQDIVARLPEDERAAVTACADQIRELIQAAPYAGGLAISLVTLELAALAFLADDGRPS